jgi:hypothetical protein
VVYDDSIMGAGSLILHDVGHSLGGFAGIPGNGALIPNVAWSTANAIVGGTPGQSALSGVMTSSDPLVAGATGSATYPYAERTPKNGLHIIRSQVNDVANKAYLINAASAISSYVQANPDHAYYLSIWQYITRPCTTAGTPYPGFAMFGTNTGNVIAGLQVGIAGSTAMYLGLTHGIGYNNVGSAGLITGASLLQFGESAHSGSITSWAAIPFMFGGQGGAFSGLHVGCSQILYRCYLEDLTVSAAGGGYAAGAAITVAQRYTELAAKDLTLYNSAFAFGGKFNGDAFTSPSNYQ